MQRILFVTAAFLFVATSLLAQTNHAHPKMTTGVIFGVPTTPGWSVSYGADLQADFRSGSLISLTASVGYVKFKLKSDFKGGSGVFIPLLGGVKSFLGGEKLYGHAQLGYGFAKGGGGSLAYAPSIGYYFSPHFDASLKYLSFGDKETLATLGVRLAYNF